MEGSIAPLNLIYTLSDVGRSKVKVIQILKGYIS